MYLVDCEQKIQSANVSFKLNNIKMGTGKVYLLPVGRPGDPLQCTTTVGHQVIDGTLLTEAFSHGICTENLLEKRPIRDAILARDADSAKPLLNQNGRIGNTAPFSTNDFHTRKCSDSQGYPVLSLEENRPATCFSLVAVEEGNPHSLYHSGLLSFNSLPFELFDGLANFLMNGNLQLNDDLVCIERYRWLNTSDVDYCARLVYPSSHYRICCCYNYEQSRLCHIHSNPLAKPKPNDVRCLVGEYDSEKELRIEILLRNRTHGIADFANYCVISYQLLKIDGNNSSRMHYKFQQTSGKGEWPEVVENEPFVMVNEGKYYCRATNPTNCPEKAEQKWADKYEINCYCRTDFCNRDLFDSVIKFIHRNIGEYCLSRSAPLEMLRRGKFKCYTYANYDPPEFYELGFSSLQRTRRPDDFNKQTNTTRLEYLIPAECFPTYLPIRAYTLIEDDFPFNSQKSQAFDVIVTQCKAAKFLDATVIADVDAFIRQNGSADSKTTGRCYARAIFKSENDSRQTIDLDAGSVDEWPLEDQRMCLVATEVADCFTFRSNDSIVWVCCYYKTNPLPKLREAIQSAVLPNSVADIQMYLENRTVCFIAWSDEDPIESKCLVEEDEMTDFEQQRFRFCKNGQNRRQCARLRSETVGMAFCCCGDQLEDCKMDAHKWGRNIESYLDPKGQN